MSGIWVTTNYYIITSGGPSLDITQLDAQRNCRDNWWWNLLYINNFIPYENICMVWTWYLADDMQFFVISPIFLLLLQRWPKVGSVVTSGTILMSWIIAGVISYQDGLKYFDQVKDGKLIFIYMTDIYIKPYTRIGPYLIGILVAFYYLKFASNDQHMRKWVVMLGWTVGTTLIAAIIFGKFDSNPDVLATAFWNALSHTVFSLGVAWIIFACLTGNGGIVNSILSWKVWIPLSRINYCAYLLQSMVLGWYFFPFEDTVHYTPSFTVLIFPCILVTSYLVAFFATLTLELPFAAMEKLLIK